MRLDVSPHNRGLAALVARQMLSELRRRDESEAVSGDLPLLDWGKTLLPHHMGRPANAMHRWLAARLDECTHRRGRKINLLAPRAHAKSTLGTLAYPLRCALDGAEPYILIVSETAAQAAQHLGNIREEVESNTALQSHYPEACRRGTIWRANEISFGNGATIRGLGIGEKLRGLRKGKHRPTLVICDDIQSDDVMTSALLREKNWRWLNSALLNVGTQRTTYVNLATALHREAISLRLHGTPGWTSKVFRALEGDSSSPDLWQQWRDILHDHDNETREAAAEAFYRDHQCEMDSGLSALWPEEYGIIDLMRMREEKGVTAFEREQQQRPVSDDTCEFPEGYFAHGQLWFDAWPREPHLKTIAIDPSKGKSDKRGDYTAFVSLAILDGIYYVDAVLERLPGPQMVDRGVELYRQFKPQAMGIESEQFQQLFVGQFESEFQKRGMLDAAPWQIYTGGISKASRIRTLGPLLSQRRLRFKSGSAGAQMLIEQLRDFPDPHSHDDGPDALEMAIRLANAYLSEQDQGRYNRVYA